MSDDEKKPETKLVEVRVPETILERLAVLAAELSGRACAEVVDREDGEINWYLTGALGQAAADCAMAMLAVRQDRDVRNARADAYWKRVKDCAHRFEIVKGPDGAHAVCVAGCGISNEQLRAREKFLEDQAKREDAR